MFTLVNELVLPGHVGLKATYTFSIIDIKFTFTYLKNYELGFL